MSLVPSLSHIFRVLTRLLLFSLSPIYLRQVRLPVFLSRSFLSPVLDHAFSRLMQLFFRIVNRPPRPHASPSRRLLHRGLILFNIRRHRALGCTLLDTEPSGPPAFAVRCVSPRFDGWGRGHRRLDKHSVRRSLCRRWHVASFLLSISAMLNVVLDAAMSSHCPCAFAEHYAWGLARK